MKKFISMLLFSLVSASVFAADQPACGSGSICVYAKMPLWNQGDSNLRDYINKERKLSVKSDPGWCGMVSSAMFLRGIATERLNTANMPDQWDSATINPYQYILSAGLLVGTDLKNGGTYAGEAEDGFSKVRSDSWIAKAPWPLSYRGRYYSSTNGVINTDILRSNIYQDKVAHYIGVGNYKTKTVQDPQLSCTWKWLAFIPYPSCKTVYVPRTFYERDGGHALVINGYDGKYLKIYDPWGRIYNVTMKEEEVSINGNKKKKINFVYANGDKGFAYAYGDNKLLMDSFTAWSLLRQ